MKNSINRIILLTAILSSLLFNGCASVWDNYDAVDFGLPEAPSHFD